MSSSFTLHLTVIFLCLLLSTHSLLRSGQDSSNSLVCGSDYKTYSFMDFRVAQLAHPHLQYAGLGNCEDICTSLAPVCGSDTRSYDNICLLGIAMTENRNLRPSFKGKCAHGNSVLSNIVTSIANNVKSQAHINIETIDPYVKYYRSKRDPLLVDIIKYTERNGTHVWSKNGSNKPIKYSDFNKKVEAAIDALENAIYEMGPFISGTEEIQKEIKKLKALELIQSSYPTDIINVKPDEISGQQNVYSFNFAIDTYKRHS